MQEKLNNWIKSAQYWIFPPCCILCGKAGMNGIDLCHSCYKAIQPLNCACPHCAEPLKTDKPMLCGHCLSEKTFFDKIDTPYLYQSTTKSLILKLKFQQKPVVARVIAQLLLDFWQTQPKPDFNAIYFVPSHPGKFRQRGFNQTELVYQWFCRLQGIKTQANPITRVRWQHDLISLKRKERKRKIKNAFALTNTETLPEKVILLDDVVTTTATVNEVARILKQAGVKKVYVLAFCRKAKDF